MVLCTCVQRFVKNGCLLPMEGHAICERRTKTHESLWTSEDNVRDDVRQQCCICCYLVAHWCLTMAQSLALKTAGLPFLQEIASKDLRTQLCSTSAHIIRDSAIISLLTKNGCNIQVPMSFHKLLLPSEEKNKFLGAPYLYLSKRGQDKFLFRKNPVILRDNVSVSFLQ